MIIKLHTLSYKILKKYMIPNKNCSQLHQTFATGRKFPDYNDF